MRFVKNLVVVGLWAVFPGLASSNAQTAIEKVIIGPNCRVFRDDLKEPFRFHLDIVQAPEDAPDRAARQSNGCSSDSPPKRSVTYFVDLTDFGFEPFFMGPVLDDPTLLPMLGSPTDPTLYEYPDLGLPAELRFPAFPAIILKWLRRLG